MAKRASGMLLHITSLSSPFGIGDLGPSAHRFANFLARAKQSVWQVLPMNPTDGARGNSPYSSISAFAGNVLLISPESLAEEGLLSADDVRSAPAFPAGRCNYPGAAEYKERLFQRAFDEFSRTGWHRDQYDEFTRAEAFWLDNYALFVVLKRSQGGLPWNRWPRGLRDRDERSLREARTRLAADIEKEKFLQFVFFRQWAALRMHCNRVGVRLIGDVPIYVSYDGTEVWSERAFFKLDKRGEPQYLSGVPPDYFSTTGQLWGDPVYDWEAIKGSGFRWWIDRISHNLKCFDIVRIDHFRGLVGYWEVPAGEQTAVNGRWVKAPASDLLGTLNKKFTGLPIIAEDLGVITPDVHEVMDRFGIPGMRVLLFAFDSEPAKHPYLPHNYVKNCVVYTGTHDNNTARGWFLKESTPKSRLRLVRYLGREVAADEFHRELIRLAMMSVADTAIFPVQDILGLGEEARMNRPSIPQGNWEWRLEADRLGPEVAESLADITETYGRAPVTEEPAEDKKP
jgi:4-alpha-glucanotransferase